jgi:quinol-cytochrome oxidoreductase complex cytochrome b subunit/coenzyme F420-reducing hydrogenase delta subunit
LFKIIQAAGQSAFSRVDRLFSAAFGDRANPLYHLGALGFYCYWIVAVSGIYLYIFFETSTVAAYQSIEQLTHGQWWLGGVMRSLHRYGSDAMVVVMFTHMTREFLFDRMRGPRWYSWFTGVPLLAFVYASGINGYWLVWDRLAQYIAVTTAEWLDWLPFFTEPIARNFLNEAAVSDRFFSLLSFLHIGIPLFLLLAMWIHIQRIARARTNPPRRLAVGMLAALLVLALAFPALSQAPANLDTVVARVGLDWFYLPLYPLIDRWGSGAVWALVGGSGLLLMTLPWLPYRRREPVAVVSLPNCNGCGWCFADCPYSAVTLAPRTDGLPFEHEAVVDPELCVACGICVGACPTATPFRRIAELVPGIDLPDRNIRELRARTLAACAKLDGPARVLVYGCRHSAHADRLMAPGVSVLTVPCLAALPPGFIDFVIMRRHADGVLLAGCNEGNCHYRLGTGWTAQRLAGERDPRLRERVPRQRIEIFRGGRGWPDTLPGVLAQFRARLTQFGPLSREKPSHPAANASERSHGAD